MDKKKKQAVLIIHGIGEQRPMDTLREFVSEVWDKDQSVHNPKIPATTEQANGGASPITFRKLRTPLPDYSDQRQLQTDRFYEFYWAHLMEGNRVGHVLSWLKQILFKVPWKLPRPLLGIWLFIVLAGLGILYLLFYQILPDAAQMRWENSWLPTGYWPRADPGIFIHF